MQKTMQRDLSARVEVRLMLIFCVFALEPYWSGSRRSPYRAFFSGGAPAVRGCRSPPACPTYVIRVCSYVCVEDIYMICRLLYLIICDFLSPWIIALTAIPVNTCAPSVVVPIRVIICCLNYPTPSSTSQGGTLGGVHCLPCFTPVGDFPAASRGRAPRVLSPEHRQRSTALLREAWPRDPTERSDQCSPRHSASPPRPPSSPASPVTSTRPLPVAWPHWVPLHEFPVPPLATF